MIRIPYPYYDREQLKTRSKNYLEIKQTSAHKNIHPHAIAPWQRRQKRSWYPTSIGDRV
jgi:hypothetical protein